MQPVRGMKDIWPEEMQRFRCVVEAARELAERYGYLEMATPVMEFTEVFKRSLGDASDVVTKEMYSFKVHDGEEMTLRPEATAAVCRAFISGGKAQQTPVKVFYHGPMFRYERPQKGRYRQFHQIDVEVLGVAGPAADVEIIALGAHILETLGLSSVTKLELNTLGDPESREGYRRVLVEYFGDHLDSLSDDSKRRLKTNPLRILDSKDRDDRRIVADAPLFGDHLNSSSREFFAEVREGLSDLGIAFELSPRMVRGLDYYTHTAFEFTTEALGAQGTVMAGGRYDGLIELLGGQPTPGIGWAAGIERLALLHRVDIPRRRLIAVVPVGGEADRAARRLTHRLRREGLAVDLGFGGNLTRRMKRANRLEAAAAVILGEDELARESVTLRDLESGEQELVALDQLSERLAPYR